MLDRLKRQLIEFRLGGRTIPIEPQNTPVQVQEPSTDDLFIKAQEILATMKPEDVRSQLAKTGSASKYPTYLKVDYGKELFGQRAIREAAFRIRR